MRQDKLNKSNDTLKEITFIPKRSTVTVQWEDAMHWIHGTVKTIVAAILMVDNMKHE